jgi:hypothetical protein
MMTNTLEISRASKREREREREREQIVVKYVAGMLQRSGSLAPGSST